MPVSCGLHRIGALAQLQANSLCRIPVQRVDDLHGQIGRIEWLDLQTLQSAVKSGQDEQGLCQLLHSLGIPPQASQGVSVFLRPPVPRQHPVYLCEHFGLPEAADYWEQVVKINEYQESRFVAAMLKHMFNTLVGKRIAIFGFAFKANTGDTRESPAIYVCRQLLTEKACLSITDPEALTNAQRDLADVQGEVEYCTDPYEAAAGAHA